VAVLDMCCLGGRNKREDAMQALFISVGILAVLWIIVLWGARYFGPQDH
jgi:hypothetical protein